ncbi:hypothetical protein FKG94_16420 [Exilibacterium tricleocarpae]|uniref:VIT domain-containing protein n=1 Tax=Exilibacterium tricleocarpae TaxID=2591008 RepID=A0A545TAE9_9GAMM|nr:VIT domain-containing protein [Exilibacterium tricleocarpae]TQV74191.1 hypothetical protein FKG94_16420 [Exilibacterium tricleocarpae]
METKKTPGWILFALGVAYPVGVICFEVSTKLCAEIFFDPLPSIWHGILVAAVPLSNFLLWRQLRDGRLRHSVILSLLAGLAIGVAAVYTLMFLPLTPLAAIAILYFGAGLLPLAPLVSLVVTIIFYRRYCAAAAGQNMRVVSQWRGILTGLLILVVMDIPAAATHLGIRWAASPSAAESLQGVRLLRLLGDEEIILRRSYDRTGRPAGPLSFALMLFGREVFLFSPLKSTPVDKVREIFYRVTGEPFNSRPPPYAGGPWRRANEEFEFDRDQGGTAIGGIVKGLHLTSSRIDGSLDSEEGVAYLEWTLEFTNTSSRQREARLQLALPPGGVVSRATLWIDGEEREAAFAGRAQVRRAYESVVRRLQDPLLVTTRGTDRVQAQAFPVMSSGGTIKFRLGITAPLELLDRDQVRLILPAIADRNFSIDAGLEHALWLESRQSLQTNLPRVDLQKVHESLFRVQAGVDDAALSRSRRVITAARDTGTARRWAAVEGGPPVVQEVIEQDTVAAAALMIVLDGSRQAGAVVEVLGAVFKHIPAGARVGLVIAAEEGAQVPIAAWTPAQQQLFQHALEATEFTGGQDNAPALAQALRQLERYENGELLWVHRPQPIEFAGSAAAFEQTLGRLTRLPRIALYSLAPGPNQLLAHGNWSLSARTLPRLATIADDLAGYFEIALSPARRYTYNRYQSAELEGITQGSAHIARLWARDRVGELVRQGDETQRQNAVDIAAAHQLVTAVSGAVVLENAGQYRANNLEPVAANSVPTIPEPEQWLLALVVVAIMLWLMRRDLLGWKSAMRPPGI